MVFIEPQDAPRLNACVLTDLSAEELNSFKKAFEYGTFAPFGTMLELILKKAPDDYLNRPHSYIRTRENEAGRTDPFILIDEQLRLEGAVWYVDTFAADFEVDIDEPIAASTAVLWEILVQTEYLPISWATYQFGNGHIHADLDYCGVKTPVQENFKQPKVNRCDGMDLQPLRQEQTMLIMAEPGDFEKSTDEEVLKGLVPPPDVAYRLKEEVAREFGVLNQWVDGIETQSREQPDGTVKEFPKGTVRLQLKPDPNVSWPPYKWPDGSL
ncbi:hypothetical protein F4774DRAFT_421091 [Daldinia eschscholtzii]|nr:hypothetical protein F4774DRAFT_421091 [Daldinia eschscholtzii]